VTRCRGGLAASDTLPAPLAGTPLAPLAGGHSPAVAALARRAGPCAASAPRQPRRPDEARRSRAHCDCKHVCSVCVRLYCLVCGRCLRVVVVVCARCRCPLSLLSAFRVKAQTACEPYEVRTGVRIFVSTPSSAEQAPGQPLRRAAVVVVCARCRCPRVSPPFVNPLVNPCRAELTARGRTR
jgi:hypothetical protein